MGDIEPFGFADGISQPRSTGSASSTSNGTEQLEFGNLLALGEVLLGYPNEYGLYTDRPLLDPAGDPRPPILPPAEDVPDRRDLGRNGSYLVLRQLAAGRAGLLAVHRRAGRRRAGAARGDWPSRHGRPARSTGRRWCRSRQIRSPASAPTPGELATQPVHLRGRPGRRALPASAPISGAPTRARPTCPAGQQAALAPPAAHAGLQARRRARRPDRLHALPPAAATRARIRHAARRPRRPCSRAARRAARAAFHLPGRQHLAPVRVRAERLDDAAPSSTAFADESDPLLGNREPLARLSRHRPLQHPACRRSAAAGSRACRSFVTVRGGAYFFLPGIRALRYIAARRRAIPRPVRAEPQREWLLLALPPGAGGGAARRAAVRAVLPARAQPSVARADCRRCSST